MILYLEEILNVYILHKELPLLLISVRERKERKRERKREREERRTEEGKRRRRGKEGEGKKTKQQSCLPTCYPSLYQKQGEFKEEQRFFVCFAFYIVCFVR